MIQEVIKFPSGVVIVFDDKGEQMPEYQGHYGQVRDMIIRDAPPTARFIHAVFNLSGNGVPREKW
jgi:hypothetical protein